ncbi:MAG: TRAP transporter small permease subunit [Rhodobiaceae bacterium]|nr:TRAP transporter small permease subunit [Rhodobiaceae bacterium]MCC0049826.1 TRAP transporter small permease subunit [Rhodobiaceae bacterium]
MTGTGQATPASKQPSQVVKAWLAFERGVGLLCAVILLTMMFLTGLDVVARYVFNAPIRGAFELTEVLLVCLVFCAMPLTTRESWHVEVALWEPTSRVGMGLRHLLAIAAGLAVFGALALQLTDHATRLAKYGSVTNSLGIPLSYIAMVAAICCALSALAVILGAMRKF